MVGGCSEVHLPSQEQQRFIALLDEKLWQPLKDDEASDEPLNRRFVCRTPPSTMEMEPRRLGSECATDNATTVRRILKAKGGSLASPRTQAQLLYHSTLRRLLREAQLSARVILYLLAGVRNGRDVEPWCVDVC